jgi:hypothetical protein
MATTNLNLTELVASQTNKVPTINQALEDLDTAGNARLALSVFAGNVTLTATQFTRNFMIEATGAPGSSRTLFVPATARFFAVQNSSDSDLVVAIVGGVSPQTLLAGTGLVLHSSGTVITPLASVASSLPAYAANAGKVLAVNVGETDVEWIVPAGGGGAANTYTPASKWFGARKSTITFVVPTINTHVQITGLGAAASDPYGFDATNSFVVPAGITKVRVSAFFNFVSGTYTNNQFTIHKNGVSIDIPGGQAKTEVGINNYSNGGSHVDTGVINVIAGDTFALYLYCDTTSATWGAWFEIEAIEHTLGSSGIPDVTGVPDAGKILRAKLDGSGYELGPYVVTGGDVFFAGPTQTLTDPDFASGPFSTSSFASKGNIFSVAEDIILFSASMKVDNSTDAGDYEVRVYETDAADLIVSTLGVSSVTVTTAITIAVTLDFTFSGIVLTSGQRIAIVLVRTDGTATAACKTGFPGSPPLVNGAGLVFTGPARIANTDGAIGTDLTYVSTGKVSMNVTTMSTAAYDVIRATVPDFVLNGYSGLQKTADYTLLNADLNGGVYQEVNSATAVVLTVPAGLTSGKPVTFERVGAGSVTFAAGAGVTINSVSSFLAIGNQFSAATLIPKGSDVYTLVGDLA